MSKGYCRWYEATRDFDQTKYYTDCYAEQALDGLSDEIAELCWKMEAEWCPFCGRHIDFCEEDEVVSDMEAEYEYRRRVRNGTGGY